MEGLGNIVIYQTGAGESGLQVRLENETIRLSQKLMAELFEKDSDTISLHIQNIFSSEELQEAATTEFFSVVQNKADRNKKNQVCNLKIITLKGYKENTDIDLINE